MVAVTLEDEYSFMASGQEIGKISGEA